MKLFLHWLRWDLRRFRVLLLIWTLLVLGYAAYLGGVQANALTVDLDWLDWSKPIASLLLVILLFFVSAILYADPARGTDLFWKTRPPSGKAVAGAKLAIVLGFFLGLPMVCWVLVKWLCVPRMGDLAIKPEINWTIYLWTFLCLCLGGLAIAAMSLRRAWQLPLRIGLIYVPLVISAFGWMDDPKFYLSIMGVICGRPSSLAIGSAILLLGIVAYLWPRRPHAPFGYWVWPLIFPIIVTFVTLALPRKPAGPDRPDVPVRMDMPTLQVQGFASAAGFPTSRYRPVLEDQQGRLWVEFSSVLNISGIVAYPAAALWKKLKITSPDGRMLQANAGRMAGLTFGPTLREGNVQEVNGAVFEKDAARSMALMPCRAEGVIRLLLFRYEKAEWLMEVESEFATPAGTFYRPRPTPMSGSTNFEVRWTNPGKIQVTSFLHQPTGTQMSGFLNLPTEVDKSPPFLMPTYMGCEVVTPRPADESWGSLRKWKAISNEVWNETWTLGVRWLRPDSYVDIPVVLDPFVLPQRSWPMPPIEEILDQVSWPAEGNAEEKRWTLRAWIQLSEQCARGVRELWEVEEAMDKRFAQVNRGDFLLLREIYLEMAPAQGSLKSLTKRLVELATEEELKSLVSDPRAIALKHQREGELAIPPPQKPWNAKGLTDEELLTWENEEVNSWKLVEKIAEGLRRGLPWAMPAAVEVLQESRSIPSNQSLWNVFHEVLQDKVPVRLKSWVMENHQKLVFDPVRRKWFLPESDKSAPAPAPGN